MRLHLGLTYFGSQTAVNARRLARSYFAATRFVRAYEAGERRRIEVGHCSRCLIVVLERIWAVNRSLMRPRGSAIYKGCRELLTHTRQLGLEGLIGKRSGVKI